jgi:hypothetical protein
MNDIYGPVPVIAHPHHFTDGVKILSWLNQFD